MIKLIGLFLMFLSSFWLSEGFNFKLSLWFIFGLFLVCSEGIFGHLLFVQREKVRSQYRGRR